ncbi:MAG: hypothetical protein ABI637_11640, partial [Gemmatimonadota bacterium]
MLAIPREAGTPDAVAARTLLESHLRTLGYDVSVQRFAFHPSSLDAFPVFGAGLGWLALMLAPLLVLAAV